MKLTKRNAIVLFATTTLCLILIIFTLLHYNNSEGGVIDMLSISTDGHYVISTDEKEFAILWNIRTHHYKIIGRNAHIYSAYFIPNSHYFLWQGKDRVIHVDSTDGQSIESFKVPFYTFGLIMTSDLHYMLTSDLDWGLTRCVDMKCHRILGNANINPSEFNALKPYNLSMTPDQSYAVGSRMGTVDATPPNPEASNYFKQLGGQGVVLWNLKTGHPVREYVGNQVQTFATISPDGQYVVAGDGSGNIFVWALQTGKRLIRNAQLYLGVLQKNNSKDYHKWTFNNSKLIKVPPEFNKAEAGTQISSIKFIDTQHYLVFYNASHYAVLFSIKSPWPIKYLNLGKHPMPALEHFERDQSMDTSPSTHTLVMAKEHRPGILVYKYNPTTQTLKKIWDAD